MYLVSKVEECGVGGLRFMEKCVCYDCVELVIAIKKKF